MFYLFYLSAYLLYVIFVLFIDIINFIVCCCCCLFVFNSFHCSCSGFSMYFTSLSVVGTLLFMVPLCIGALLSVCHRCFVFAPVLFSLLTQCVSYSSYCHCYLYNLALVLLVWLLALLVYNFPSGDFTVN